MAHLIHGTFPAVAGVFHTKGYLMDETPNQGMSGYEAYKEERKQLPYGEVDRLTR